MDGCEATLSGHSVLVVDDEALLRRRLLAHLASLGAETLGADSLHSARAQLGSRTFDFVLLDIHLPDGSGLDLLSALAPQGSPGVVVMTAQGGVAGAVEAMRLGALDYLIKPFDIDTLPLVMRRARQARQSARLAEHAREEEDERGFFFGDSLAPLRAQLDRVLAADARLQARLPPVLITGETGTGKSSLARWLHRHGPRATQPFVAVNCSVLSDTLAESELFGHERGAFTDAKVARQGLFEAAHGGTLFLDELPCLSPHVQAKVLTAIEERTIRRVGGTRQLEVDVRIVAATSRDLRDAVARGEFREDLMHRLDLLRLCLPPLRERGCDVLTLADALLAGLCRQHRLPARQITEEGRRRLQAHRWPGNVRELAHELERALVFEESCALRFAGLGAPDSATGALAAPLDDADWLRQGFRFPDEGFMLEDAVGRLVQLALRQCDGNVSRAARMLGVTRDYLRYKLHGDRRDRAAPGAGEAREVAG